MIVYTYVAPGHGQITLEGQNFDGNWKVLALPSFVVNFEKINKILILCMYITQEWADNA